MRIIHLLAFFLLHSARALEKRGEISDYDFVEHIGSGSYGNVWLVRNTKTNEEFVAKILHKREPRAFQLFAQEISFLKAISASNASNVIKCIDSFSDPETETPVLILEKANGIDFYDWIVDNRGKIRNGQLNPSLFYRLMHEAAKSVKQVHALGICHRDIKVLRSYHLARELHAHYSSADIHNGWTSFETHRLWPSF